jgi:hypothetical protein
MSDPLARGFALDDFGGPEKLLDLIFAQRGLVGRKRNHRKKNASKNNDERARQASGQFLHGGILPKLLTLYAQRTRGDNSKSLQWARKVPVWVDFSLLFSSAGLSSRHEA